MTALRSALRARVWLTILALLAVLPSTAAFAVPPQKVTLTLAAAGGKAARGATVAIDISATIEAGWHINAHEPTEPYLIPTEVTLALPPGITAEPLQYPPADRKKFAFAEGKELRVYQGKLGIVTTLRIPADFPGTRARIEATMRYQACNDTLCLPPSTVKGELLLPVTTETAATGLEPSPPSEAAGASGHLPVTAWLDHRGLLFTLFAVALLGVGLNLTPCVYPLISVTVAYFGSHGRGRTGRTAMLAGVYVLGIALSFSALGVMAALSGGLFGAALQKPAVTLFIAVVMVALALSSFGVYQLQPPPALMRWAGGSTHGVAGAAFMGLTMGIVAAPCIGPLVLALLVAVGARHDPLLGFGLFFALGIGMGLPYLVLAVAAGSIKQLPRSGEWLVWTERLFGFILLGMAAYFVSPLLSPPLRELLLPGLMVIAGVYLGFVDPAGRALRAFRPIKHAVGLAAVALALWLGWPHHPANAIQWRELSSNAVEALHSDGRPAVIDFGAEWCIPCKEMARTTFVDAQVVRAAAAFDMLRADITEETDHTKKLIEKFDVRGVPTVLVYDANGHEVERLIGYTSADELLAAMKKAGGALRSGSSTCGSRAVRLCRGGHLARLPAS